MPCSCQCKPAWSNLPTASTARLTIGHDATIFFAIRIPPSETAQVAYSEHQDQEQVWQGDDLKQLHYNSIFKK
jgi:hypothetical protein